jgi:hypothetical protein
VRVPDYFVIKPSAKMSLGTADTSVRATCGPVVSTSLSILLLASFLHGQTPQRTILSTPAGVRSAPADSDATNASGAQDPSATALEKYREMWRKMTPAQQKAFVDSGGYTPEQYERTLKQKGSAAGTPQNSKSGQGIDPTMDSLSKSLQDLNAIRDGNLGRVQKDGCPPEVASRIADLKGKLQGYESELNGVQVQIAAAARTRDSSGPADPLSVATDWYKSGSAQEPANIPAGSAAGIRAERQSKALSEVLASSQTATSVGRSADPGSPEAQKKRQAVEQDIARTKAEIEQLSGACIAPAR